MLNEWREIKKTQKKIKKKIKHATRRMQGLGLAGVGWGYEFPIWGSNGSPGNPRTVLSGN
jgi:hypothetical protein